MGQPGDCRGGGRVWRLAAPVAQCAHRRLLLWLCPPSLCRHQKMAGSANAFVINQFGLSAFEATGAQPPAGQLRA